MSDSLDVIIVDDDPSVCEVLSEMIKEFYVWGDVLAFSDSDEAIDYCSAMDVGVAIFVLDVFLGSRKAFAFLDAVVTKFPMAHEDTIVITGKASNEVVDACIASDITTQGSDHIPINSTSTGNLWEFSITYRSNPDSPTSITNASLTIFIHLYKG